MSECKECVFKDVHMWDIPCNECKESGTDFFIQRSLPDFILPGQFLPTVVEPIASTVLLDSQGVVRLVDSMLEMSRTLLDSFYQEEPEELEDLSQYLKAVEEDEDSELPELEDYRNIFTAMGAETGDLVNEKNHAYGDSFSKCGDFLQLLYPDGIQPKQYVDMLGIVRIFDKQMRIATNPGAFEENPWQDIVGYGLLGMKNTRDRMEVENKDGVLDN